MRRTPSNLLFGLGGSLLLAAALSMLLFPPRPAGAFLADSLSKKILQAEQQVQNLVEDQVLLDYFLPADALQYPETIREVIGRLEKLQEAPFYVSWCEGKEVRFAAGLPFAPPQLWPDTGLWDAPSGYWYLSDRPLTRGPTIRLAVPLSWKRPLQRSAEFTLGPPDGSAEIRDPAGRAVASIREVTTAVPWVVRWQQQLLLVLGLILLWTGLLVQLSGSSRSVWPAVSILLIAGGLTIYGIRSFPWHPFPAATAMLAPVMAGTWFGPNLLTLLTKSLLTFLVVWSLHRRLADRALPVPSSRLSNLLWGGLGYAVAGGLLLLLLYGIRTILTGMDPPLDFDPIFVWNPQRLAATLSITIGVISTTLLIHLPVKHVGRLQLGSLARSYLLIGAMLLTGLAGWKTGLQFPVWSIVLLGLILVWTMELLQEYRPASLSWLLFSVLLMAGFSAITTYKYYLDASRELQATYARQLSAPRDPLLEAELLALPEPKADPIRTPYLWQHYQAAPETFPEQGAGRDTLLSGRLFFSASGPGGLRYWLPFGDSLYLAVSRPVASEAAHPYQADFRPLALRGLAQLDRFAFQVWVNGQLSLQEGSPDDIPLRMLLPQEEGRMIHRLQAGSLLTLYRSDAEVTVYIQQKLGGYLKPLSLLALYFFQLLLLLGLGLGLQQIFPWIPQTYLRSFQSLRQRIQLSVIGLVLFSALVIAAISMAYFSNAARKDQQEAQLDRIPQLTQQLQQELSHPETDIREALVRAAGPGRLPLEWYDFRGRLQGATYLADDRLHQPHLPPSVLAAIRSLGAAYIFSREQTFFQHYRSLYLPIYRADGQAQGILAIPFSPRRARTDRAISDFIGSLFSICAFLLLVAAGLSILVANQITRPLETIRRNLAGLGLEKNQRLSWEKQDEIGTLIKAYNTALDKLEVSTEKLKITEREGAWREMAKQVAHEIKNPLTPMKLSMQHLLRTYREQPERTGEALKRVGQTIIEQIDGLNRIANEFSHFAKMPKAQNAHFQMDVLVRSVFELFREEAPEQVHFAIDTEPGDYRVFADREQLMRVLNNLLKNALQALPPDRGGTIAVRISGATAERPVVVEVADNGVGIPEDIQPKVFVPNFTTKSSGTGLGLAMSKNIIEQAGGSIRFTTRPGQGTRFFIELPAASE